MQASSHLAGIQGPRDLDRLTADELAQLCAELREYIIATIRRTGGHLAPSLGVVELTVALHRVFDSPRDKIVWDVGHQCYAHKILTGRREAFPTIRQADGLSGFCRRSESPHDAFGAGHASTSISAALGIATARDLNGEDFRVVAVIGDGGLSGGLALEGLDRAGDCGRDLIVVLNDNNMSISPTVGAISRHLTEIITHPLFERAKKDIWELTARLPRVKRPVRKLVQRIEGSLKGFLTPGLFFENLGFRYLGPIDGHDIRALTRVLAKVREMRGPVLVHVLTQKGRGMAEAEDDPCKYHGIAPIRPEDGKVECLPGRITYTDVLGETLCELGARHGKLTAITAAMADGTGLVAFHERFPARFHDVGIAEEHAVTFAAGLATQGLRPVVAVYSTFMQRSFDQLVHDVALQRLPVVFALDRAGLVGEDGATHHGSFDLAYLSCIPNFVVAAPRNGAELRDLLATALAQREAPFAIRYPRAGVPDPDALAHEPRELAIGSWEELRRGPDGTLLAVGTMVDVALAAGEILARRGMRLGVVNARFVKPLDTEMLARLAGASPLLVTLEEHALAGGFSAAVSGFLSDHGWTGETGGRFVRLGLPDRFVEHGPRAVLLERVGLTAERVAETLAETLAPRRSRRPGAGAAARERVAAAQASIPEAARPASIRGATREEVGK